LTKKEDKTADMESIDFKFYYIKIYSNEEPTELKDDKKPKIRFQNLNKLPEVLANNIKKLKFDYLTPIQRMVMPYIQIGKDIVCVAETGSGKTLAYLFPIIGQMLITGVPKNPFIGEPDSDNNKQKSDLNKSKVAFPLSLILVPTRELAIQVSNESKKLSFNTGIRTVAIYGGEGKRNQIIELAKGCDILVATPGRLIDLIDKKLIDLRMVKHLILDEADRMLDQNFYPDLRRILDNVPKRKYRQNLLFSATFDDDVKGLAKFCLNNYYFFKPVLESPKQIKHEFIQVYNDDDKITKLKNYLKKDEVKVKSILIFLRTKAGVDELGRLLCEDGIKCCTIHGDKQQPERNKSIREFISGKNNVLIATDVASRGLDFPKIYCVINFDIPQNTDDYIHRCGRTGRSGQEGMALTFIDGIDINSREKLLTFLRNQNQEIPDWLKDFETGKKFKFFGTNKRRKTENEEDCNKKDDPFKKPFKSQRDKMFLDDFKTK
jgi:ATP-dependent RNA helicase DDX3X